MGIITGLECKAYYNTGTQDVPVWVEFDMIINLSKKMTWEALKATCRQAGGFAQYIFGEGNFEVSFTFCHNNASTAWEFWRNAMWTKTPVHLQILDGANDVSGSDGVEGTFGIFELTDDQQLSSTVEDAVTLKPSANGITASDAGIVPERLTIA